MISLRGERQALALAMSHRNELTGVVLVGQKPSGGGYRPDEIEVLANTAHQIGLDFHALKVEKLETTSQTPTPKTPALSSKLASYGRSARQNDGSDLPSFYRQTAGSDWIFMAGRSVCP